MFLRNQCQRITFLNLYFGNTHNLHLRITKFIILENSPKNTDSTTTLSHDLVKTRFSANHNVAFRELLVGSTAFAFD